MTKGKTNRPKKEKRRENRVACGESLEGIRLLQMRGSTDQRIPQGKIVDMSDSGIGIRLNLDHSDSFSRKMFPTIEEGIMLRLRVPIKDTTITMPILGQVLWMKKEPGKKSIRAGIRFVI